MATRPRTGLLKSRLERARSALGEGIAYRLGQGGFYPRDPLPSRTGGCDCSGFVAWCLGLSRRPKITRPWWIETTNVWNDATGRQSVFAKIQGPIVGCLAVYPDRKGGQGHIGVVSKVEGDGTFAVVDCSVSGRGIAEHRQPAFWRRTDTVFCVLREDCDRG